MKSNDAKDERRVGAGQTSRSAYLRALFQTAKICAPTLVESATTGLSRSRVDKRLRQWARRTMNETGARAEVSGRDRFSPHETFVVMSNHQSNFDIIALYYAFPSSLRMVAKMEMRRIPFFGTAMEAAEFIFVDRGDNAQARAALDAAKQRIQSGISVWIAPEGTRSKSGDLGEFKKGGFMLALAAGVCILPCTIGGTRAVAPVDKHTVRLHQRVTIEFHDPVDPAEYGLARRSELIDAVRDRIAKGM